MRIGDGRASLLLSKFPCEATMPVRLLVAIAAALLSGCASQLSAFYNRSVVKDNVGDSVATVSLSADRRTVLVGMNGENRGRFCAEPPPDSATGLKTDLESSLKASGKSDRLKLEASAEGGLKDKTETTVVLLAERTPALDAFRTGVYALCQFHLNGAVTDAQVGTLFTRLIEAYENTAARKLQEQDPTKPVKTATAPEPR
jgi:hypothetical protein